MPHATHSTIPHPVVVVVGALSSALRLLSSKFDLYVQVCLRLCHAHTLKIVAQSAFEPETAQAGRQETTGQDKTRQDRAGQAGCRPPGRRKQSEHCLAWLVLWLVSVINAINSIIIESCAMRKCKMGALQTS